MESDAQQQDGAGRESNAYERIIAEDRRVMRETLRVHPGGAHAGLALTVLTVTLIAAVGGVRWALIVGGSVAALYALVLVLVVHRGRRRWAAVTRAYLLTFGWGGWL